jgi:hypothetical protein
MGHLTGKEFAEQFERFANGASEEKKEEFAEYFCRMHRTNQQSAFGTILKVVDKVGSDDYRFDGRNEESHKRAKMMVTGLKAEVVKDLMLNDPYYWTEKKTKDFIYGEGYNFTMLPLV